MTVGSGASGETVSSSEIAIDTVSAVVGIPVWVGFAVGCDVGGIVGFLVGCDVGAFVGFAVGWDVGESVGGSVGVGVSGVGT